MQLCGIMLARRSRDSYTRSNRALLMLRKTNMFERHRRAVCTRILSLPLSSGNQRLKRIFYIVDDKISWKKSNFFLHFLGKHSSLKYRSLDRFETHLHRLRPNFRVQLELYFFQSELRIFSISFIEKLGDFPFEIYATIDWRYFSLQKHVKHDREKK